MPLIWTTTPGGAADSGREAGAADSGREAGAADSGREAGAAELGDAASEGGCRHSRTEARLYRGDDCQTFTGGDKRGFGLRQLLLGLRQCG